MPDNIILSYIISVFNKEPYVGYTAKSLLQQEGGIPSEYIFVDDVSTDRSVEVVREATREAANVTIITNNDNRGPSVRVNQGARLARGKYLLFIDSDDILAANASALMLRLMEQHDADIVHGNWERTNIESALLLGRRADENLPYKISDDPKAFVFSERVRRMAQMVRREMFLAAGGCDEGVFIQDESLALRLARVARRMILLEVATLLIPKIEGELSRNILQLNHDRFLASRNMILEFPDLDERMRRQLYRRCLSSAWKERRHLEGVARALASPEFWRYVKSQCALLPVDSKALQEMSAFFAEVKGVRRSHA